MFNTRKIFEVGFFGNIISRENKEIKKWFEDILAKK